MTGLFAVCRAELARIFTLKPAFATLIVATLIYSVFYPQPYVNEALRDVPIAVVDRDQTIGSRDFIRRLDASADVAVAEVVPDLPTAQRAVFDRSIFGILVIPQYFERDLLHGRPSPVALYADASYFLLYQRVSGAVGAVARTVGAGVETTRLIALGIDPPVAEAAIDPMPLTAVPLFNPQGGYATYILPAAFVLLVQQILLMGVGLLNTHPRETGTGPRAGAAATILGKLLAYLVLETAVFPFYLIVLPYLYGIPRLGSPGTVIAMGVPFVLATGALGLVIAGIFKKPLAVQLAFAAVGIPFLFLAGFSWPVEAIPPAIRLVSVLLPSTAAINGIVRVSQMGAPLAGARDPFLTLWALAAVYAAIALLFELRRRHTKRAR